MTDEETDLEALGPRREAVTLLGANGTCSSGCRYSDYWSSLPVCTHPSMGSKHGVSVRFVAKGERPLWCPLPSEIGTNEAPR